MSIDRRDNGYLEDDTQNIIYEFCHLLEKSKQLFNGLRDLPQYGHKQWQSYFGRAFDVYTKLWKFQQQHRELLDGRYGLKRWQIGEIASKIGQLYYHYYLRTSETNYLNESFAFYSAIRMRAYYSKAHKEERPDLMVKKLRYYARFVIVCLLLKRMKLVRDLVRELAKQIDDYTTAYQPEDAMEWSMVLQEIKAFIEADSPVTVLSFDSTPAVLLHRLTPQNCPPLERCSVGQQLQLAEILIVGNCQEQVKFSELTLDMFRMLQTLEREPQQQVPGDTSPAAVAPQESDRLAGRRNNPHKYLLYKPSLPQFLIFLASSFKELGPGGALLLYISADGDRALPSKRGDDFGYAEGGVATNNRREAEIGGLKTKRPNSAAKNIHCIYPADICPYTRKPMFLVVDSDNSFAFKCLPNLFSQPLVCLMSPEQVPANAVDSRQRGNLFTLFLHSPLTAFCCVCRVPTVSVDAWDRCQAVVQAFLLEVGRLLVRCRQVDAAYLLFYQDDFLRLLVLRYLFCSVVLRLHKAFRGPRYYPACHPQLPEQELLTSASLHKLVMELAGLLEARSFFGHAEEISA